MVARREPRRLFATGRAQEAQQTWVYLPSGEVLHAKNIKKPLLVVQGANDPRVLKVESDEIVEAAKQNGAPVEYLMFEDEGHGFEKKQNRVVASGPT